MEKSVLNVSDPPLMMISDSDDPSRLPCNSSRVLDVVRGMCICPDMTAVTSVIRNIHACPQITLVRQKDRFVRNPSPGGWRDYMICFYLNDDKNRHVCELQVVHKSLLTARKGECQSSLRFLLTCVRAASATLTTEWSCDWKASLGMLSTTACAMLPSCSKFSGLQFKPRPS